MIRDDGTVGTFSPPYEDEDGALHDPDEFDNLPPNPEERFTELAEDLRANKYVESAVVQRRDSGLPVNVEVVLQRGVYDNYDVLDDLNDHDAFAYRFGLRGPELHCYVRFAEVLQ